MSEIWPIVATGIVGSLSGILGTLFVGRRMFSDEKLMEKLDVLISEVTDNEEMQRKIYTIGGLLGKGIRDGTGIANMIPKRKGGLEGLVMDFAGSFISQNLGLNRKEQGEGETEVIPPGDLRLKQRSKW